MLQTPHVFTNELAALLMVNRRRLRIIDKKHQSSNIYKASIYPIENSRVVSMLTHVEVSFNQSIITLLPSAE